MQAFVYTENVNEKFGEDLNFWEPDEGQKQCLQIIV